MKNLSWAFGLLLLSFCLSARGQSDPVELKPLGVGDTLPPYIMENVMNHPEGPLQLGDYRGSWLVLDFWASWCGACIGMFPKTDSLEQLFEGKIHFLPVTYEPEAVVQNTFARRKLLQGLKPPMVVRDVTLRALFPHESLPHYVWIDPQGVVRAQTSLNEVNAANIRRLLEDASVAGEFRQPQLQSLAFGRYDKLGSLHALLPEEALGYQSTLTGFVEGLDAFYSYQQSREGQPGRIISTNTPILNLYQDAYSTVAVYFGFNRIVVEVEEKEPFNARGVGETYLDWLRQGNGYCYELQFPARLAGQEFTMMQEDLDRLFPQYRARVEEREWPVWALVRTNRKEKFKSRGGKATADIRPLGVRLQNTTFHPMVRLLNIQYMQHLDGPVVDLTGYEGMVDLELEAEMNDVESLRKALQPYGLDLQKRKATVPVLVVRDAGE
jgi:thiol-disulfide isomerase/thioredoxin